MMPSRLSTIGVALWVLLGAGVAQADLTPEQRGTILQEAQRAYDDGVATYRDDAARGV